MSKVYLVGAGPGDPELLTLKGKRVLEKADVVLYDHLASRALLELAPARAERIYVGKKKAEHAATQEEICEMMVARARRGLTVVRLKGGDPFIFGRGGEEVEALAEAGVPFEVVPGVTAPLGIAAYTGVPLTHREHTSVVSFVTGHDPAAIDWSKYGSSETLVIFMGLHHIAEIVRELVAAGRPPATPAMAVRWGTRPDQHTVAGTLAELPRLVAEHALQPPATVIIGDVVALRKKLNWYEKLPLFGRRVLVTRARAQSAELIEKLHEVGAEVVELPVIEMRPPADTSGLDCAIRRLEQYDWAVFTSTNAVEFFFRRLDDVRRLRARLCAIGKSTRAALEARALRVELTAEESMSEGLAATFTAYDLEGKRVLLPRAAAAREVLPEALSGMGAIVEVVTVYENVIPEDAPRRAAALFAATPPDWISFTSSSTVNNLIEVAGRDTVAASRIASIGPVTSKTVRRHGLEVHAEAAGPNMDALVAAMVEAEARRKS
ncbi:MAG: uroporphyrinogen-III C-methyltransferase [Acidobacteria bacterium]|nr:uroporphyrinogen-III C-methyltransferase [Acidobacteriota bacterium]